jgi:DNA-binding Lrp family transcriptional regulator
MPDALINIDLDREKNLREIADEIAKIDHVQWARLVLGPDDVIAYVETANWIELETTLFAIGSVEGVLKTDSRVLFPK